MHTFEPLIREIVAFGGLVGLLVLWAILLTGIRTRELPSCWRCGFNSVRQSQSHRRFDNLARLCLLYPYRCDKCLQRSYRFRPHRKFHSRVRSMEAGTGRSK